MCVWCNYTAPIRIELEHKSNTMQSCKAVWHCWANVHREIDICDFLLALLVH